MGNQWIRIVPGLKNVAATFGSASILPVRSVHQRTSGPVLTHIGDLDPLVRDIKLFPGWGLSEFSLFRVLRMWLPRLVVSVFSLQDLCTKGHQVPVLTHLGDLCPLVRESTIFSDGDSVDSHYSWS